MNTRRYSTQGNAAPTVNAPHEEMRRRTLEVAGNAFRELGIKGVRMDDVAHRLGISKRTLYQLFTDKEQLLLACVKEQTRQRHERTLELAARTDSVLELLLWIFEDHFTELKGLSPTFISDLVKFPTVMQFIEEEQARRREQAVDFLQKGAAQGYFREDVNFGIIYDVTSQVLIATHLLSHLQHYSLHELFVNIVILHIRGCATEAGMRLIDDFLQKFRTRYQEPAACS